MQLQIDEDCFQERADKPQYTPDKFALKADDDLESVDTPRWMSVSLWKTAYKSSRLASDSASALDRQAYAIRDCHGCLGLIVSACRQGMVMTSHQDETARMTHLEANHYSRVWKLQHLSRAITCGVDAWKVKE